MRTFTSISKVELADRKVWMRADLNVPLEGTTISSDARIRAILPTLRHILEAGAKVVLSSHLGRPKGGPDPKYSLEPVAARLSELIGQDVILAEDCVGDSPRHVLGQLGSGEVMLLENLRFHAG